MYSFCMFLHTYTVHSNNTYIYRDTVKHSMFPVREGKGGRLVLKRGNISKNLLGNNNKNIAQTEELSKICT